MAYIDYYKVLGVDKSATMDTAREKQVLEKMLATGNAPWKKWED